MPTSFAFRQIFLPSIALVVFYGICRLDNPLTELYTSSGIEVLSEWHLHVPRSYLSGFRPASILVGRYEWVRTTSYCWKCRLLSSRIPQKGAKPKEYLFSATLYAGFSLGPITLSDQIRKQIR